MYSPQAQSEIAMLRAKAMAGQATQEDFTRAIALLREDRASIPASAGKSPSKRKAKTPVNTDALFDELEKL